MFEISVGMYEAAVVVIALSFAAGLVGAIIGTRIGIWIEKRNRTEGTER